MQGIFQKENTDKALKYGIYRHLPTYEKIIRNLVSFLQKNFIKRGMIELISGNTPAQITDLNLEDIILRKQILSYLEKNSKMDPREIAILLGTEPDVVENEIRKMEEEKIICGYHTMIDWDKTSSEMVTALIEVRVTPQRGQGFDSIAERIYKYPEVRSVYLISGGYDLMVILEGKTLKEVSQFVTDKLSTLDSVLSTATHFILKKYKDHGTIFDQKIKDERMLVTP